MKKKVLLVILLLATVLTVLLLYPSLGWFMDSGSEKSQAVDVGYFDIALANGCDIRSAYTDEGTSEKYVAPGENMIYIEQSEDVWRPGPLTIVNKSTIPTSLRVKVEYTFWGPFGFETVVYSQDHQFDFSVVFREPLDWQYDETTEYWNYLPDGNDIEPVDLSENPDGVQTALIDSLGYSDTLGPGSIYEDESVSVKLKVEAKQAEYATWIQVMP